MANENNIKLFEEYYDTNVEWWKDTAANFTTIPVGMCGEENYNLTFDEEGKGAFPSSHAIIVGVPGCGKSSLLHTMIVGSCIKYSPNELRLVLVDMKSNEFKQYDVEQLPHAEIIANHATPEVGCQILHTISEKVNERIHLFQDKCVSNYYDYRKHFSNEAIPRYLIIVDEYAPLIQDFYLRREVLYHLNNIIVRGRIFGFNLILSSQTVDLPGDMVLYDDYKSEPFRIVMRSNPFAAKSLLGFEDGRAAHLKVGQALIHTETTNLVQCYYLPENERSKPDGASKMRSDYLKMIRERWNEKTNGRYEHDMLVYDRERPAILDDNKQYKRMSVIHDAVEVSFSPGERMMFAGEDFMCKLTRAKNENVLALGGKIDASVRSINGCLMSMLPQLDPEQVRIDVVNYVNPSETEINKRLEESSTTIGDCFKHTSYLTADGDMEALLDDLIKDIEDRSNQLKAGKYVVPRFLVIYSAGNNKSFHEIPAKDNLGKTILVKSELTKKLMKVLETGSEVGVHCLIHFNDADAYFEVMDATAKDKCYFNHRLLLQMMEDDSKHFLDPYIRKDASNLVDKEVGEPFSYNIALYYNAYDLIEPVKIKPYEFLSNSI